MCSLSLPLQWPLQDKFPIVQPHWLSFFDHTLHHTLSLMPALPTDRPLRVLLTVWCIEAGKLPSESRLIPCPPRCRTTMVLPPTQREALPLSIPLLCRFIHILSSPSPASPICIRIMRLSSNAICRYPPVQRIAATVGLERLCCSSLCTPSHHCSAYRLTLD